jgi:hypothetical protein
MLGRRFGLIVALAAMTAAPAASHAADLKLSLSYAGSLAADGVTSLGSLLDLVSGIDRIPSGSLHQFDVFMELSNLAPDEHFQAAQFDLLLGPGLTPASFGGWIGNQPTYESATGSPTPLFSISSDAGNISNDLQRIVVMADGPAGVSAVRPGASAPFKLGSVMLQWDNGGGPLATTGLGIRANGLNPWGTYQGTTPTAWRNSTVSVQTNLPAQFQVIDIPLPIQEAPPIAEPPIVSPPAPVVEPPRAPTPPVEVPAVPPVEEPVEKQPRELPPIHDDPGFKSIWEIDDVWAGQRHWCCVGDYIYNTDELNRAGYFETFPPVDFQFFGNGENVIVTAPTGSAQEHQLITVIDESGNYAFGEPIDVATSVWRLNDYGTDFDEARFSDTSGGYIVGMGGLAAAMERVGMDLDAGGLRYSVLSGGDIQFFDSSAMALSSHVSAPEPGSGVLALLGLIAAWCGARYSCRTVTTRTRQWRAIIALNFAAGSGSAGSMPRGGFAGRA